MWPDYCKKETLARRLDLEIGAVDQYVKRGLLPSPHKVGEALLFCWQEVDSYLRGGNTAESEHVDPYDAGARRAAEAAASRRPSTPASANNLLPKQINSCYVIET